MLIVPDDEKIMQTLRNNPLFPKALAGQPRVIEKQSDNRLKDRRAWLDMSRKAL